MKKIVILLMVGVLVFSISACSDDNYAAEHIQDIESEIISYETLDAVTQSKIKTDFVSYLKMHNPDNTDIQKLTSKDILLMDTLSENNEIVGYVIDWYGNTHQKGITTIDTGEETIQIYNDLKEMAYCYKDGSFIPVETAYATGLITDNKGLKFLIKYWETGYEDGKIYILLTMEMSESYTDNSVDVLTEKLGISITDSEFRPSVGVLEGKIGDVYIITVHQRGKRELYDVIHILSKHSDVQQVTFRGLDTIENN